MNLKSAWAFCATFFIFPYTNSYAGVLNEETKKQRLEFLAKGKHNCEFNISIGHNFSRVTYNTGLSAKFYTRTGEIALYDPSEANILYQLPTPSTPGLIYPVMFDVSKLYPLLNLGESLDIKFFGGVIPIQFDFNYVICRRFKIGLSEQIAFGFYYDLSSANLGNLLNKSKNDKKTSDIVLLKRFVHTYLKKKLSVDYRTYLNTCVRLLDYNPYSLWLNIQNGLAVKMGNKIFGKFLILGYTGNLYLSLEKYLSRTTKVFFNFGLGCNVYYDEKHFDQEGKNKLKILDLSLLNFSFGFSFGSNDGRYEDYMYQKAEYDFYIDKYQTTFDYYDESFPVPEF